MNRYLPLAATFLLSWALFASSAAQAQSWPAHPIRWIVPYTAGGTSDFLARMIGQKLSERLGQPVVIENKPGAGGNLGTGLVASAAPDGYMMVLGNIGPIAVSSSLYANLPYDPPRDFEAVTLVAAYPTLLLVNPAFPVKTVKELIDSYRVQGKSLSYGTPGVGTSQHLTGELFSSIAGINTVHVPYKGSAPSLNDAMAGHIPVIFDTLSSNTIGLVKSGKLRALAITSIARTPLLPEVPTVSESGLPSFEVIGWSGVLVPKGTPPSTVKRLEEELTSILQSPEIKSKIEEAGALVPTLGSEHFRKFIGTETSRWKEVVERASIKPQ